MTTLSPKRKGLITASRCADLMTSGRGAEMFGETAKTYAKELALARLGYEEENNFTSWQMEWGNEHEADAREIYEQSRGVQVDLPGFIEWEQDPDNVGCTPDGFVGHDGILEIKCPQWKSHFDYLIEGIPDIYYKQVQFQLMVTDREWADFMTFHPNFPDGLQAKVFRIERDDEFIALIQQRIEGLKGLIDGYLTKLTAI